MTKYNFGEKQKERVKNKQTQKWEDMEVWQTPKYLASKKKAIELIDDGSYNLVEGDFWILMNRGGAKMCYTGLIIAHNGCLKINDKLDNKMKFKPESVSFLVDEGGSKVMQYINPEQGVYEFGEISQKNCSNDYPYAMVLKRLMDRVILKTSKVGFFGIYSDSESEEFKNNSDNNSTTPKKQKDRLGEVADESMKEQFQKKNEEDFVGLKDIIESCGGEEELKDVWTAKENVKIINSLKKWNKPLYEMIVNCKNEMKNQFEEEEDESNV